MLIHHHDQLIRSLQALMPATAQHLVATAPVLGQVEEDHPVVEEAMMTEVETIVDHQQLSRHGLWHEPSDQLRRGELHHALPRRCLGT